MSELAFHLKTLHVIANLFWIGGIVAVGLLLSAPSGSPRERGALARSVYLKLAAPAFLVAFAAGAARLLMNLDLYFQATRFMHGKLTFAVAVIAIHHVLGVRAKRMANGTKNDAGPARGLTIALAVLVVGAAFLAVEKPF